MSARRLLLIDSDDNFFRILHEQVSPYGFEIYRVEETPDALDHVPEVAPQLICIAVEEPDKVGYSLCNKAKKGVAKDIPVILTTSSVPPSGFHSHRKLKVHADEYIDKRTMSTEELVGKIDGLVGLSGGGGGRVEEMNFDDVEEFELSDDAFDESAKTRIAAPHLLLDIDPETDAAVASLTSGMPDVLVEEAGFEDDELATSAAMPRDYLGMAAEPGEATVILSQPAPAPRPAPVQAAPPPVMREERASRSSGPVPVQSERASRNSGPVPVQSERASRNSGPVPVAVSAGRSGPMQRAEAVPEEHRGDHRSGPVVASASAPAVDPRMLERLRDLERDNERLRALERDNERLRAVERDNERLRAVERDNERLKADLDAARQAVDSGGGASSFSRERELLSLREVINKKERELLDLRDELGSKERQILEGKEQVNQLQHSKAALDSKNLELEQRLLEVSEQLEAEKAGTQHRLHELQARIQELEVQVEQTSASHAQAAGEIENLSRQLGDERAGRERALAELTDKHARELDSLKHELEEERRGELQAVRGEHEAALRAQGADHAQAVEALKNEHQMAVDQLREAHAQELRARDQQHQQRVHELEAGHAQQREGLEAARAEELARVQRDHDSALAEADRRHKDEMARALAEAQDKHAAAERALRDGFAAERDNLERGHAAALAELRSERDQLESGLGSARQTVADLERSLEQARGTIAERDHTIEQHRGELANRAQRIAALEADVEELENQNTGYQEQVLKAFQKIKIDEATVAKAKKALAIALTLLDDNIASADDAVAPGKGSGQRLS